MKNISYIIFCLIISSGLWAKSPYPAGPELSITMGKLCDRPTEFRYPEKIPYCDRDVTYQTKEIVMKEYDQKFGYRIAQLPRGDFKIDHFIPLCVGGSNDISNLWPQHKSVYEITDPLEPVICEKMALGKLKQKDAVQMIIDAKTNPVRIEKVLMQIKNL